MFQSLSNLAYHYLNTSNNESAEETDDSDNDQCQTDTELTWMQVAKVKSNYGYVQLSPYFKEYLINRSVAKTEKSTILASELHSRSVLEGTTIKVKLRGLLPNWTSWQSPNGKIFYYNEKTNETRWLAPVIPGWNKSFTPKYFGPGVSDTL